MPQREYCSWMDKFTLDVYEKFVETITMGSHMACKVVTDKNQIQFYLAAPSTHYIHLLIGTVQIAITPKLDCCRGRESIHCI